MRKLLIFDLDDTLFETKSIGEEAVKSILENFESIASAIYGKAHTQRIITDLWKLPFDAVATKHEFTDKIIQKFKDTVNKTDYNFQIKPFDDFDLVRHRSDIRKFLVTTGFRKLQLAKIKSLGLEKDFEQIYIDDITDLSRVHKKGILKEIIINEQVNPDFIYVIGDNPESELKAGHELGLTTVQISKFGQSKSEYAQHFISDYSDLLDII